MKKTILTSLILTLALNATDNINYNGNIVNIKLSKDSWNRLIFDSEVNAEPIYSKEKNIEIYKANKSVFIKFKPMMKVEIFDKKESILDIDYDKSKKSELFVSTAKSTYSFTIEPTTKSAATYFIQNNQTANDDILKFEIDPVRKVLKNITKDILLYEVLKQYEKSIFHAKNITLNNLDIKPRYIFDGTIYKAYLYDVTALEDIEIPINERIFLSLTPSNKRSISIKDKKLEKNQTTQLVIVVGK